MSSAGHLPTFPPAQQAQTIRSNQRDLFHVSALKEQAESVLRIWFGTRWLSRWEKEIDLLSKLLYFGFTTGQGLQTLGEEYTNIWQINGPKRRFPSSQTRAALVLLTTLPSYLISRLLSGSRDGISWRARLLRNLPSTLETLSEINLAIFYLRGAYYDLAKRALGIRNISGTPQNPQSRPPSYAFLGILIGVRLLYRLITTLKSFSTKPSSEDVKILENSTPQYKREGEPIVDEMRLSKYLSTVPDDSAPPLRAEDDEHTIIDFSQVPEDVRARRNCTLCLEERTGSCATECGHLFCWNCITSWGKEKAECPLCRQSLSLTKLLPVYNM